MKLPFCFGIALASAVFAQAPGTAEPPAPKPSETKPAESQRVSVPVVFITPSTVVATVDGRKFTAGELDVLASSVPGLKQNMNSNPQQFLQQYGLLIALSKMAEEHGLEKVSPFKERIEYAKMQVLYQAELDHKYNQFVVPPEEVKKYYEANKDKYTFVKIKAIYIPFSSSPPPQDGKEKKVLTEAEALEKAKSIVKEARAGADFVKLVKEHSQDSNSVAKDGDFGTFRKGDKIPDHIKAVIFALKTGEVSDPVRQPFGFYIFRAEEAGSQTYEQAAGAIVTELRDKQMQAWLESLGKQVKVEIETPSYFSQQKAQEPKKN